MRMDRTFDWENCLVLDLAGADPQVEDIVQVSQEDIGYSKEDIGYSKEDMGYSKEDIGYSKEDIGYS